MRLGFSIPPHVFGPGLSIPHYGTIVVNSNSVVGANCRLHVCTNIGASGGSSGAPHLGNNIYIGPGAIIYGEIVISDNVWIAANATLGKSVLQENVIVAGSPAKIVKDAPDVWWKKNGIDLSYNLTI